MFTAAGAEVGAVECDVAKRRSDERITKVCYAIVAL
jgi:hypothetical protein